MSTYPYCGDWMLEPPDDSRERDAFERASNAAFREYLDNGWLPGNHDPSHVDEQMLEAMPEALDELIKAEGDAELIEVARRIRDRRIEIIEQIIHDNLPEQRKAA